MSRKSIIAALAALTFGFSAAAAADDTPQPGGTLRFVMKYEPPTLSSINNTSTPLTSGKIFDGLVTYDYDLKPMPQLATSWEIVAGRPEIYLQAARGRDLARRQAVHLGRRRLLDPAPQARPSARPRDLRQRGGSQHARPADAGTRAVEARALPDRRARRFGIADRAEASLRGRRRRRRRPDRHC